MESLIVVMPAYQEEAISDYVAELDAHLRFVVSSLEFVIVDDASPTAIADLVPGRSPSGCPVTVVRNEQNLGHGPTAWRAYSEGLRRGPALVLHVDGDGQFAGAEVARLVASLGDGDIALGRRVGRREPWYRAVLSRLARELVGAGEAVADVNSPLRLYRSHVVAERLASVPPTSLVPHLHFSRRDAEDVRPVVEVAVAHRERLGDSATGTMWGSVGRRVRLVPPRRLLRFAAAAAAELVRAESREAVQVPDDNAA